MPDYNNPSNVLATFDFDMTSSNATTYLELITEFPQVLDALINFPIPQGYTLVLQSISPELPTGIYKRGSFWSETVNFDIDNDGVIDGTTVNNYQVISLRDLDYSKATDFQKFLYDNLQQITNYFENITGEELSDRFGIFVLRNKIITQSTLPESEKGLLSDLGWTYKNGKWTKADNQSKKGTADITPLIFAAIGGVTGGAPGALAGFLFSLVTQQQKKQDEKQKTVSTETVTASSSGIPSGIGFNI